MSELRRSRPHGGVVAWLRSVSSEALCLSPVTLGEIQRGIEIVRDTDAVKAREIESWADKLESAYAFVAPNVAIFRCQARLMRANPNASYEDALIGATATVLGYTVVTRYVRDFQDFPAPVIDPFRQPRDRPQ